MQIYKFCALAGAFLAITLSCFADTLTFIPQPGIGGTIDYSWFTSGNWFSTDAGGNLIPAGRLPLVSDTAVITVMADAGTSGLRVQTLLATNNAIITNGTFAIENLVMLSGSSFNNSMVNVLVTMAVGGTNCALNGTSLSIISIASGIFQPIAPALAATLSLGQGTVFLDQGQLSLTDGSQIISSAPPQSQVAIGTGALLSSTNLAFLLGSPTNHLIIDNSGTIRADGGTLRFDGGIDWRSSGGAGEFKAVNSNAFVLFATPFHVDAGVVDTFSGSGTNRWMAGASADGAAQINGNLEILDSVSGAGNIEVLGTATPGGVLTWSNGSLALASATVDAGATMILSGGAGTTRQLSGCMITNSGTCALRSGDLALTQGSAIFNLVPGTFELQGDGTFSGAPGPMGGTFNNAGTFLKTSSGITAFGTTVPPQGPDFNNTGLVDIQSGQLNLFGGISSGEFRSEPGAVLWFWGGTHTLNFGAGFTGGGAVRLLEGIAPPVWLVNTNITIPNLEVGSNGTLDASGNTSTNPITIGALLADSNGSLNNGNFAAQNFQMQDQAILTNSTLSVSNALTITGPNCALWGSTLNLLPTGSGNLAPVLPATNYILNLNQGSVFQDGGVLILNNGSSIGGRELPPQSRLVVSAGALLVSSNLTLVQGATSNHLVIDNSGTVRADSGVLQFGTGLDWKFSAGTGEFKAAASQALLTFGSPFHLDPGTKALFSGPGTNLWLNGGTLGGEAQVSGNLEVLSGVNGPGILHVLGSGPLGGLVNWTNGVLSQTSINIDLKGTMLINAGPGSNCQLSGCSVNNSGACLWVGPGPVAAGAGASFNNLPGGTLDLQTDVILTSNSPPLMALNNGGLLLKSGGTGSSSLAADFFNYGDMEIKAGTLTFQGAWAQALGSTIVDAGAVLGGTILNVQGGTLQGLGTIAANLVNSGAVNPGSLVGTLTIAGTAYQQTASGTLALEIAGSSPGTQYDRLVIAGTATLAGRLELNLINGFTPKPGDRFEILTSLAQSGAFASLDPSPIPGTVWVPQYNGTNVTVTLADTVSLGQPTLSKGVFTLPFNTTAGLSYVVQATDGLIPPAWQTLYTVPGSGAVMNVSDSVTNAQRFYRVLIQ
jgi:hypothetical protein